MRKRIKKKHLQRAALDIEDAAGIKRPKVNKEVKDKSEVQASHQSKEPAQIGEQAVASTSVLLPSQAASGQAPANASMSPLTSTPAPMSESQREDLKMLSLASGNSKKAKSLRRDMLNGRRQTNKKIVYTEEDTMSIEATPDTSAILADISTANGDSNVSTQALRSSSIIPKQQPQKPVDFFPNGVNKRLPPPPPSTRSDLPSNVVVSSVDVEAEDFVPGIPTPNFVAPPQVPYSAQKASSSSTVLVVSSPALPQAQSTKVSSASDYFNAYSGYYGSTGQSSKGNNKRKAVSGNKQGAETTSVQVERSVATLDKNGWPGWPSLGELEGGLFETLKKVTAPGDGENVAVKVSFYRQSA